MPPHLRMNTYWGGIKGLAELVIAECKYFIAISQLYTKSM